MTDLWNKVIFDSHVSFPDIPQVGLVGRTGSGKSSVLAEGTGQVPSTCGFCSMENDFSMILIILLMFLCFFLWFLEGIAHILFRIWIVFGVCTPLKWATKTPKWNLRGGGSDLHPSLVQGLTSQKLDRHQDYEVWQNPMNINNSQFVHRKMYNMICEWYIIQWYIYMYNTYIVLSMHGLSIYDS